MAHSQKLLLGCALPLTACMGQIATRESDLADESVELAQTGQPLCAPKGTVALDARKSLVVTEQQILARFSYERVMTQLASQSGIRGLTGSSMTQQLWDTQNPTALGTTSGPHCDTTVDPELGPVVNGFPYACRAAPAEGSQSTCNPFTDTGCSYMPIGLFNRFDLAPADGSSCGEMRIVFAKASGQTNARSRNLIIFEASIPNPAPKLGLEGCRPFVDYWASLSSISSLEERARRLEQLYFRGIGYGMGPVVDIRNFGDNALGRGQLRTNQFVQDGLEARSWSLREFKLRKRCATLQGRYATDCSLTFAPVSDKGNPYGPLFSETSTHPMAPAFQETFVDQVESLAKSDLMSISMNIPDVFNSAQSQASGSTETDYLANFDDGGGFAESIEERLAMVGSELEPVDIVERAQTQTCAGCHRFSNGHSLGGGLTWPASLGFTHVTETAPETVDGVVRFRISDALTTTFLPQRLKVMTAFLLKKVQTTPRGRQN